MKTKNKIVSAILGLAMTTLVACGGGGGGTSTGGVYFTHAELADEFVYRLNIDLGYDVELVKTNTKQYDYIVVYDYDLDTYDAYDLTFYNPGEDLSYYLADNDPFFYYDLDYDLSSNVYTDFYSGYQFSRVAMTSQDSRKANALVEQLKIDKAKEVLSIEFGLTQDRAQEVASLAVQLNSMDKSHLTIAEYNRFSEAIVGSSIDELKDAALAQMEGNNGLMQDAYTKAATVNGSSKSHMKKLVDSLMMK
ncbi:MAG: hypothetical protein HOO06_09785 [Bdellovibrionaceae bacterium]|jgi:hypothetical protein|nr:hypothetical protein [Pseudobdellovibrionaceae bacterium]